MLDVERTGDRIRVMLDRPQLVRKTGKSQDVNGRTGTQEIEPSALWPAALDKLEIEHRAVKFAGETLLLSCDVAAHELQFLLFLPDNVGHYGRRRRGRFPDREMAVVAVDEHIRDRRVRLCRLQCLFPPRVWNIKSVLHERVAESFVALSYSLGRSTCKERNKNRERR